jgi:hypothetical protein
MKTMTKLLNLLTRYDLFVMKPPMDRHGLRPRDDVIASDLAFSREPQRGGRQFRVLHAEAIIKVSRHTNATKTHYSAAQTIINFNNKTFATVETC